MSKSKTLLIIALFAVSLIASPMSRFGTSQTTGTSTTSFASNVDPQAALQDVGQVFGMFRSFGASGALIGQVLQTMFQNFWRMNGTEKLNNVYVMNGTIQTGQNSTTYNLNGNTQVYHPWGQYNLQQSGNSTYRWENPYFELDENGTLNVTVSEGVSITFIIYYPAGTLISAINQILTTIQTYIAIQNDTTLSDQQKKQQDLNDLLNAVMYFLIHINDIITGDQVIILNMIGYSEYVANLNGTTVGTWYVTQNGQQTDQVLLNQTFPSYKSTWLPIAQTSDDQHMIQALEYPGTGTFGSGNQNYTRFSFDCVEVWLKNFQIHINVAAIVNAINTQSMSGETVTDIFQGLDIEFYIITHSFQNIYLYNETASDVPTSHN